MNITVNLFLFLIKCTLFFNAHTANIQEFKIIGGHEAKPNSHPYLVSLKLRFLWVRVHMCGAAILKESWVLSAAHCSIDSWLLRLLPMDAVAGSHHISSPESTAQVIRIKESIPHPLYDGDIGPYDVAVLKTESPFTFNKYVQPIKLPTDESLYLKNLKLVGWGALRTTVFLPDLPNKLQEVKVSYIPYDECYRAVEGVTEPGESNPLDKDAHICTGPISGGVAACNGDSGGPLVQNIIDTIDPPHDSVEENTQLYNKEDYDCGNKNTEAPIDETEGPVETKKTDEVDRVGKQYEKYIPVVLGVVSWGASPCGMKGAPTVYTNVSTYIDFINYNINNDN